MHERTTQRAAMVGSCVLAIAAMGLRGCATPQGTDGEPPAVEVTAQQLIERHNARAQRLDQLHAYGVIELWWTDDRGRHYEQADAELWIDQPSRTALRVDKAGEVFLWLGSNEQSWWLFDMLTDPTSLITGPLRSGAAQPIIDGAAPVHPLTLLDLLGITSVSLRDEAEAVFDRQARQWVVNATGRGGPVRLVFDESGRQVRAVHAIDETGGVIATGALREYESARVPGTNQLNWPKSATQFDIELADDASRVVLSLNNDMSATLAGQPADAVFDLERLKQSLRPEVVQQPGESGQRSTAGDK